MTFDPAKDVPELDGKVVIVTGSTSGIGFATAQILVRKGAKVYLAARSEEKAKVSLKRIEDEGHEKGQAEWLQLDLADPALVKKAAEEFLSKEQRLDILINNAAIIIDDCEMDSRGILGIMTVNYFSPFIFTDALLPLMKTTAALPDSDVRIVNVSSEGHRQVEPTQFKSKEDFNVTYEGAWFATLKRYGLTKLCTTLWTNELQRRLTKDGHKITCISLHPGSVYTEGSNTIAERLPWILRPIFVFFARMAFLTPIQGAATSVIAATTPDALKNPEKYKGAYMEPVGKIGTMSKTASNAGLAEELWTTTEAIVKDMNL